MSLELIVEIVQFDHENIALESYILFRVVMRRNGNESQFEDSNSWKLLSISFCLLECLNIYRDFNQLSIQCNSVISTLRCCPRIISLYSDFLVVVRGILGVA